MKQILLFLTLLLSITINSQTPTNGDVLTANQITNFPYNETNIRLDLASLDTGGQIGCNLVSFETVYYKFTASETGNININLQDASNLGIGQTFAIIFSANDLNITSNANLNLASGCVIGNNTDLYITQGSSYYVIIHRTNGGSEFSNINFSFSPAVNPVIQVDRDALLALYNTNGGSSWFNSTNWNTNIPEEYWQGVTTAEINGEQRVVGLNLYNNNVIGDLTPSINDLSEIRILELGNNNLTGTLPTLTNLTNIERLLFYQNQFTGTIPLEYGNLTNLIALELWDNNLTGGIPSELSNLNALEFLFLFNNNLSGIVPDLSTLPILSTYGIGNNSFLFGDLEPAFNTNTTLGNFNYSPQKPISDDQEIGALIGENGTLDANTTGTGNQYQWYFNNVAITGETNATLTTTNFQASDYGVYHCDITNPTITGLTLQTGNINIVPSSASSPDYDALVSFYNTTNGDNWTNRTNWLDTAKPLNEWFGVTTQVINGEVRVTAIKPNNNNINGSLPNELLDLTELRELWIQNGFLSGEIPINIGSLTNLTQLVLTNNFGLTGNIPSSLLNCPNLQYLIVGGNNFSGVVPDFTGLTGLQLLWLNNNSFEFGDFENEFNTYNTNLGANFTYLNQNLVDTAYSEVLVIGSSTTLTANLSGAQNSYQWFKDGLLLPGETNNTLNVTINTNADFGVYTYQATSAIVTGLTLFSNNFTLAETPSANLDYATLIDLYNSTNGDNWTNNTNWLDNTKPLSEWWGIQLENNRVSAVILGSNGLTGTIPASIDGLTELKYLSLFANNITGIIPSTIGNLSNLIELDLSPNSFSGTIPPEIGNLTNLEVLWLNQNGLTGSIPQTFQNLTNLRELYLIGRVSQGSGYLSSTFSGDFPDLTGLANLEQLQIDRNYFQFTDIADEFTYYQNNLFNFTFSPQYTLDAPENIPANPGDNITLSITDVSATTRTSSGNSLVGNTYQWLKDGVVISGATSIDYTIVNAQPTDSGLYTAEITNTDVPGMVITREPITVNVGSLSIEDIAIDDINIYPNPTRNTINIKLNNDVTKAQAILFDINGRIIQKQNIKTNISQIDLSLLANGVYLLKLQLDNKTITKRIIKTH